MRKHHTPPPSPQDDKEKGAALGEEEEQQTEGGVEEKRRSVDSPVPLTEAEASAEPVLRRSLEKVPTEEKQRTSQDIQEIP